MTFGNRVTRAFLKLIMAVTRVKIDLPVEEDTKLPQPKKPFNPILWNFMIALCIGIYGTYAILLHLSKENGTFKYSSAATILLMELFKLVVSLILYKMESKAVDPVPLGDLMSWRFILPFSVPAILYCCTNNLGIHLQNHMDPATYQILSNLKILSTAILYRIIMKRSLSWVQWLSLFILFAAACQNSIGSLVADQDVQRSSGVIYITITGILMILLYSTLSGLAGVYSEYILKDKFEVSINVQNTLLYAFGIILNGSSWLVSTWNRGGSFNLIEGFNTYVWITIALQAAIGLIISVVMKYSSNITRLFIISSAAFVATFLSVLIFGLQLNFYFCFAFVLFIVALVLYHKA